MSTTKPFFLVLEGINGAGKTTQVFLLEKYFLDSGRDVVVVREPGGTKIGEKIRELLKYEEESFHPCTQLALFLAARAELTYKVIIPALKQGKIVISDRYTTSTLVYQGYASVTWEDVGWNAEDIQSVSKILLNSMSPDLTIILDLPVEQAWSRRGLMREGKNDRYEKRGLSFQRFLRDGYLHIAKTMPNHVVVDAFNPPEQVREQIVAVLLKFMDAGECKE